jgi:hypothetical protein
MLPGKDWKDFQSCFFNVQKTLFYIKIILSDWVTGTPVNFGGMTGTALAVILKLNQDNQKVIFKRSCLKVDQTPCIFILKKWIFIFKNNAGQN